MTNNALDHQLVKATILFGEKDDKSKQRQQVNN
jgi:hypothetical protein